MDLYLSLTDKRSTSCDEEAESLRTTILDVVLNRTFVVDCCRNAIHIFNEIVISKNFLIAKRYMSEDEIKTFEIAQSRMDRFVKEIDEHKRFILITNGLNFREQLVKISMFAE